MPALSPNTGHGFSSWRCLAFESQQITRLAFQYFAQFL